VTFLERLASGLPILTDGGTGIERRRRKCGAADVHAAFVAAGVDVIVADSIAVAGLAVTDPARGAAALADAVAIARASGAPFVAASLGPSGPGVRDATHRRELYGALAAAAKEAGADVIFAETLLTFFDADAALDAARAAGLPIAVTFAFSREGKGYAGLQAERTAQWAQGCGPDAAGFNCGEDPEATLAAFERWIAALVPPRPWLTKSNSRPPGAFRPAAGTSTPERFAVIGAHAVALGARIVGGCCGATPDHLAALVARVRAG